MSLIGKEINEFKAQAYQNGEFKEITKADLLGKWNVFFFYPADFTFVCPTELEDLADKYEEFKKINCEIYSVSCDSHFVHKAWHDTSKRIQKIQYPMLADPTASLAKDLDVYIAADGMAERGTFIINPEGKIVAFDKIRSLKRAVSKVEKLTLEKTANLPYKDKLRLFVFHSNDSKQAEQIKQFVNENFPDKPVDVAEFSPVIATHLGEKSIAIAWMVDIDKLELK